MDWAQDKVGGRSKAPRLSDMADVTDLSDGKNHILRMIGPAKRIARHWITIQKEDGGKATFPKLCLGFNHETGEVDKECPYCDLGLDFSVEVLQNAIDRDKQEEGPRKKNTKPTKSERKKQDLLGQEWSIIEGKDSTSWTPVKLHTFQGAAGRKLGDIVELNKKKTKKGTKVFGPEHAKYGFDIAVKNDPSRKGAEKHGVQKADETELTEEELDYLLWSLDLEKPEKLKVAQKEAEGLADRMVSRDDDDDKKKGKKSKSKKVSSDDDDDEDEDSSWGDDDDDDAPKKKKGSKSKKSRDDDDDDDEPKKKKKKSRDEDDEDDDEDEDDKPKKKKKRPSDDDDDEDDEPKKKKKSKKSRDDDDEDDDEDEDDDDKPKKKSKKSSKKDDDWDEDDEDEPSVKKKGKKSKSDDDDDDDDEDDEPKKKSKKSSGKKSSKKSKKSDDDEDDEDDDDWGSDDDDDDED